VIVRGFDDAGFGFAQIAAWLGRGLEALGIPVAFDPIPGGSIYGTDPFIAARVAEPPPDEPSVQVTPPDLMAPYPGSTVYFTMFESAGLSRRAVAVLNRARAVIVPCSWCAAVASAAGVERPTYVVPLGVDPGEGYTLTPMPDPRRVVFGLAGRMHHGGCRKNLNAAMRAFSLAFPARVGDVQLRVKVWADDVELLEIPDDPRIVIDAEPATPRQMAAWLKRLSCYVCPSRGEGWGLITHQAMAVGRPCLAARWSGTAEFWDDRAGWELPYELEPAGDFYVGLGLWAVPTTIGMIHAFRTAYRNRGELAGKGAAAAALAGRFTWDRTGRELLAALRCSGWEGLNVS